MARYTDEEITRLRSISAVERVREINAESNSGWKLTENEDYWKHCPNGYELQRSLAFEALSDLWEDTYGRRPRHIAGDLDLNELEARIESLLEDYDDAERVASFEDMEDGRFEREEAALERLQH